MEVSYKYHMDCHNISTKLFIICFTIIFFPFFYIYNKYIQLTNK